MTIPAVSIISQREIADDFNAALEKAWLKSLEIMNESERLIVFCAQECFQELSVMVKARKLWKNNSILNKVKDNSDDVGSEYFIQKSNQIRYYSAISVPWGRALPALNAVRLTGSCFGVLECKEVLKKQFIEELFVYGFNDSSRSVCWDQLILSLAARNWRTVRVTGRFDDNEVSIDLFN